MDNPYEQEITRLLKHMEAWANGTIPRTEENIARFTDVLAEGFMIVSANSHIIKREHLVGWFQNAHGTPNNLEWLHIHEASLK